MNDKKRTAIHEAGHVVMAMHLKVPIEYAEIIPSGNVRCLTIPGHYQDNIHLGLAGIAAEDLFYGDGKYPGGHTDLQQASEIATKSFKGDLNQYMDEQLKLTKRVIFKYRHYVEVIARQLEAKGRLTAREIQAALAEQEKKWEKQRVAAA